MNPPVAPSVVPAEWLQYGAFGLLCVIVLYVLLWAGPQIVQAVKSIGPTITELLEKQEARHTAWMKEVEERHTRERTEYRQMIAQLMAARET